MLEFIKMFGLGVMYTVLSPLIAVFFALFLVYSFFNYLVCEVINLSGFFLGKRFTAQTELDKEYAKIKKEKDREESIKVSVVETHIDEEEGGDLDA